MASKKSHKPIFKPLWHSNTSFFKYQEIRHSLKQLTTKGKMQHSFSYHSQPLKNVQSFCQIEAFFQSILKQYVVLRSTAFTAGLK